MTTNAAQTPTTRRHADPPRWRQLVLTHHDQTRKSYARAFSEATAFARQHFNKPVKELGKDELDRLARWMQQEAIRFDRARD